MHKIGTVAKLTGFGVETIRYYEHAGVLPAPDRAENGYRLYGDDQVRRLRFIKRCRELGFTLENVRSLLSLSDGEHTCCEVKDVAGAHLKNIRGNIRDLQTIEQVLHDLVEQCSGDTSPDCPILEALFNDADQIAPRGET